MQIEHWMADYPTMDQRDDADRRARFDRLCLEHRSHIFRFTNWLCHDSALADDVVQETFLRAWGNFESLLDESAMRSWLLTIARRELARTFERKRLALRDIDNLTAGEVQQLGVEDPHEDDDLRLAILALPEPFRESLILQVLFGYSVLEIAELTQVNPQTIRTRLFRARERLRLSVGAR